MKRKNAIFFKDDLKIEASKDDVNRFCNIANQILDDLTTFEVSKPKTQNEAIRLIYSGTDQIRQTIIENQKAKMSSLPAAAAEKLISLPTDSLNKLGIKMYAFQNRRYNPGVSPLEFVTFENGTFISDFEKLETHFTLNRNGVIDEAERLCKEFIKSFEAVKSFCKENNYSGSICDFDGLIHSGTDQFEINPEGFQYFPQ